jgi:hypothetical protein
MVGVAESQRWKSTGCINDDRARAKTLFSYESKEVVVGDLFVVEDDESLILVN